MATIANVIVDNGSLYIGTAGAHPTTLQGYTEEGFDFTYTPTNEMINVHEETVSISSEIVSEEMMISSQLAESVLATLNASMSGASLVSHTITLGGGSMRTISARIVGTAPGTSKTREILMVRCFANAPVGMEFRRTSKTLVPVQWNALVPTGNFNRAVEIADFWDVTIASGVAAASAGAGGFRVAGQGDAADVLDSITGRSDGDVLELRIQSASNAITVTDNDAPGADEINLTGTGNFVMDNMLDRLVLTRTAGSWVETSRIDA
jgi:hypothetical protein